MKASVIITTYSRPEFLQKSILSALNQSCSFPFEVIVVDDNGLGSDFQKETELLVRQHKDVVYLPLEKNSGACLARNKGVEISKGEYIFFLDDDDAYLPEKIETQTEFLDTNLHFDGFLAAFKRVKLDTDKEIIANSNFPAVGNFKNFVLRGNFFTPMLCIRKTSFEKTNGFIDIPRFQDKFFMMNALLKDLSFGTTEETLHVMYEHEGLRVTSASVDKTQKSLLKIRSFVKNSKIQFTKSEWDSFLTKQMRILAVTKYTSVDKSIQRSSSLDFLRIFLKTFMINDFIMAIKSLIK